ncbi:MAG: MerR family transcriptional regulator [Alphaproteobacteria bacterium]
MSKSPEAFRTISEVANALDLPQHVLRFWETRFKQIKPMKRGGGRRYYRPADVTLLRGIRRLLYGEGYTIRGVQRILKEQGIQFVTGLGEGHPLTPQDTVQKPAEVAAAVTAAQPSSAPVQQSREPAKGAATPAKLAAQDIKRLEGALGDLVELKRLLDQAR